MQCCCLSRWVKQRSMGNLNLFVNQCLVKLKLRQWMPSISQDVSEPEATVTCVPFRQVTLKTMNVSLQWQLPISPQQSGRQQVRWSTLFPMQKFSIENVVNTKSESYNCPKLLFIFQKCTVLTTIFCLPLYVNTCCYLVTLFCFPTATVCPMERIENWFRQNLPSLKHAKVCILMPWGLEI